MIEQKQRLIEAMETVLHTTPTVQHYPDFDPTMEKYHGMRAITYTGMTMGGKPTKVFAYIGFPEWASLSAPVPGIVLIHGGGGHPFLDWVQMWNARGYAAIAMDTTGFSPTKINAGALEGVTDCWTYGLSGAFAEDDYADAPTNDSMRKPLEPVDTQWMYHAVGCSILAHNLLRADPRVDSARIGVTGISWGGTITSLLIGYDTRFAFAIPIYGSGYLREDLAPLGRNFEGDAAAMWLAEERFDRATMPILWLCWNDDNNFSIQSNSLSWLHTRPLNGRTFLSIVHNMGHSHIHGWNPPISFLYADWIVKNGMGLVRLRTLPEGRDCRCQFELPAGNTLRSAKLYCISEEMTYVLRMKHGNGPDHFMTQEWQTADCTVEGNTVCGRLPADAWGYYMELIAEIGGAAYTVTSQWVEKSASRNIFRPLK